MSTPAQNAANQANSQLSTGPTIEAGKAASSLNHFKYGLTGTSFAVLPWENEEDYDTLLAALRASLNPSGPPSTSGWPNAPWFFQLSAQAFGTRCARFAMTCASSATYPIVMTTKARPISPLPDHSN
jgi:hypothetical protein